MSPEHVFMSTCLWAALHEALTSYNRDNLNSLLTYSQQGFIAQLVEHHTGIAEVMGLNPVDLSLRIFFWTFFEIALVASQLRGSLSLVQENVFQWMLQGFYLKSYRLTD